jgi:hypothetical protein
MKRFDQLTDYLFSLLHRLSVLHGEFGIFEWDGVMIGTPSCVGILNLNFDIQKDKSFVGFSCLPDKCFVQHLKSRDVI